MSSLLLNRLVSTIGRQSFSWRCISLSAIRLDTFKVQDEQDFKDKVINSKTPVVIDFFATWCGPCKVLEPRLEVAIGSRNGKVHLAKVDVDELQDIAAEYGVESLPTVVAMKGGKVVDKFVGVQDEDIVLAFVEKHSQ